MGQGHPRHEHRSAEPEAALASAHVPVAHAPIAVTGAHGFLGRALVPSLLGAGHGVRALVRSTVPDAMPAVDWRVVGDLVAASDAQLRDVLAGVPTVLHLAAQAHRPHLASPQADTALHALNATLPVRLARAAAQAGVRHFVFASSVKVHGETSPPGRALREDDPLVPADAYGESKAAAEEGLAGVARESGMRVTALRLPLVYGPGARANFAALIRAVRKGVVLPVGSIANRRSLLSTGNLASALLALLAPVAATCSATATSASSARGAPATAGSGELMPYLLADAHAVSTPELVRALAAALDVAPRILPFPPAMLRVATHLPGLGERVSRLVDSLEVDSIAFRTRFGWTPPLSLAVGLAAAVRDMPPL